MGSGTACRPGPAGPSSRPAAARAATACRPERRPSAGHVGPAAPEHPSPLARVLPVRDRRTFAALRAARRARGGPVTVACVPSDQPGPPRVAYAVGRRVGGAVQRNRLRRRLRAIVAEAAPRLGPGAYLVGAGPGASALGHEELRSAVHQALDSLAATPAAPRP